MTTTDTRKLNTVGERYYIKSYRQFGCRAVYYRAYAAGSFHSSSYNAFLVPNKGLVVLQRIDATRGEYHTGQKFGYMVMGTLAEVKEQYGSLATLAALAAEEEQQGRPFGPWADDYS